MDSSQTLPLISFVFALCVMLFNILTYFDVKAAQAEHDDEDYEE